VITFVLVLVSFLTFGLSVGERAEDAAAATWTPEFPDAAWPLLLPAAPAELVVTVPSETVTVAPGEPVVTVVPGVVIVTVVPTVDGTVVVVVVVETTVDVTAVVIVVAGELDPVSVAQCLLCSSAFAFAQGGLAALVGAKKLASRPPPAASTTKKAIASARLCNCRSSPLERRSSAVPD
jgi:hypothetical protein